MKAMVFIKILLPSILCLLTSLRAFSQATTVPPLSNAELLRRVEHLEGFRMASEAELKAKAQDQDHQIDMVRQEVKLGNATASWQLLIGFGASIIVLLGGYPALYQRLFNQLQLRLEPRLEQRLDTQLTHTMEVKVEEKVVRVVDDQKETFKSMLSSFGFTAKVKDTKKLMVVCENDEEAGRLQRILQNDLRFKHVTPKVMSPNLSFDDQDLVIFVREDEVKERGDFYKKLSVDNIKQLIEKAPNRNRTFVCYIPQGEEGRKLNTHKDQIVFANTQITLGYRILEYFLLQDDTLSPQSQN